MRRLLSSTKERRWKASYLARSGAAATSNTTDCGTCKVGVGKRRNYDKVATSYTTDWGTCKVGCGLGRGNGKGAIFMTKQPPQTPPTGGPARRGAVCGRDTLRAPPAPQNIEHDRAARAGDSGRAASQLDSPHVCYLWCLQLYLLCSLPPEHKSPVPQPHPAPSLTTALHSGSGQRRSRQVGPFSMAVWM